jgi:protocatechuate 3,4-dioxygenase beta subunit
MKSPSLPLALFCFLLASLPASAQQPTLSGNTSDQGAGLASVAGQVLRADTGEPLKKARILLQNDDDNSADPYIAITDVEGRFLITGIRAGRYSMRIEREGFLSKSYGEEGAGDSSSILSLKPGQQLNDLIFRLQKCAVISGRVLDDDGEPARFVSVEAIVRSTHRGKISTQSVKAATTNDLGEYRLFDLDPGSYFVSASVEQRGWTTIGKVSVDNSILKSVGGYIPTYYPSSGDISRASTVEVKAGGEVPGVDIILLRQRSYTVRGQVIIAATDHPLSSGLIAVELFPAGADASGLRDMRQAQADAKTGEFEISDVPPGNYKHAAANQDERNQFVGVTQVEVVNADVFSVRIVITHGADLRGRVIKEGRISSSIVRVAASPRERDILGGNRSGETKSDGTFLLVGLPDGIYDVSAGSEGCDICYVKSETVNGVDVLESGLTVSAGLAPSPMELVLSDKTGIVDGTVKNDDGSPVAGATVVLIMEHHEERDDFHYASTDQSGYFIVRGIAPGKYHAFPWKNVDYSDWGDPEFRQPFLPKAQAFSISEDEKKTVQLALLPASADTQ